MMAAFGAPNLYYCLYPCLIPGLVAVPMGIMFGPLFVGGRPHAVPRDDAAG
jgi:hypothetical protein